VMLIVAESWRPLQLGETKPAGAIWTAYEQGAAVWIGAWALLTGVFGLLIRWYGRALASVIALGTLGATAGGGIGLLAGRALSGLLDGTAFWQTLSAQATGIVLVEGALALLGAIFVGYWLLVWAIGKLPPVVLIGVVSVVVLAVVAAIGATVAARAPLAIAAVAALGVFSGAWWWQRKGASNPLPSPPPGWRDSAASAGPAAATLGTVLLSVALVLAGVLLAITQVIWLRWAGAAAGAVAFVLLWRALSRRFSVDARLILREMSGRRTRVASTLLGLSVGIAGLSLVSLTTGAVSHILEFQLSERAEGNLLVVTRAPQQAAAIRQTLDGLDGIEHYAQFTTYRAVLEAVNGEPPRFEHSGPFNFANSEEAEEDPFVMILSQRSSLEELPAYEMASGRRLLPSDAGKNLIMVRESFVTAHLGIRAGDRLQYRFRTRSDPDGLLLELEVVGVVKAQSAQAGFGDQFLLPPDTLPRTVEPLNIVTVVQVNEEDPAYMDQTLAALADVPGAVAIELGALTQLLKNLLEQLNAIPTLVAWLALLAGTAIIANTVALATQERRRQIGVMKAVGLKGWRVLGMLVVENGLIGLLAGLIGAGVGLLVTVAVVLASQSPEQLRELLELSTIAWLILLGIGVAIGAAMLSAWGAAAEKPMNVLRYE